MLDKLDYGIIEVHGLVVRTARGEKKRSKMVEVLHKFVSY
jgi:hypothetical protein